VFLIAFPAFFFYLGRKAAKIGKIGKIGKILLGPLDQKWVYNTIL